MKRTVVTQILHLNLHREFFAAIVSGEKRIEYRRRSLYWRKRLEGRRYDAIVFRKRDEGVRAKTGLNWARRAATNVAGALASGMPQMPGFSFLVIDARSAVGQAMPMNGHAAPMITVHSEEVEPGEL